MIIKCNRCLLTSKDVKVNGQCEICDLHDTLKETYKPEQLEPILQKIRRRKGKYNCLIGISGGFDSAILLDKALEWGLKPLVIHFDNSWNTKEANHNIKMLTKGVDFIRYHVNQNEYDSVQRSLLMSGTPDCDTLNDMVMTEIMYRSAIQYGIKYIMNGHNYRTEGSTPRGWTYMDAVYIESMHGSKTNLPLLHFWDQVLFALKGIQQVRPFYYWNFSFEAEKERVKKKYGLKDYGGKHKENIMTDFIGTVLLPAKFGIDKSLGYRSAYLRSGDHYPNGASSFDYTHRIMQFINPAEVFKAPKRERSDYERFNFKRYRLLVLAMVKLGALPLTFYKKYCV